MRQRCVRSELSIEAKLKGFLHVFVHIYFSRRISAVEFTSIYRLISLSERVFRHSAIRIFEKSTPATSYADNSP